MRGVFNSHTSKEPKGVSFAILPSSEWAVQVPGHFVSIQPSFTHAFEYWLRTVRQERENQAKGEK